tara:strand:+ start:3878 stop:4099 length:222 start_codon:yes stop_codon:yes gene_type:complete
MPAVFAQSIDINGAWNSTLSGSSGVMQDDGDGVCANVYVDSSTSIRFEIVSCDSPGACAEDPIGKSGVLTKVY